MRYTAYLLTLIFCISISDISAQRTKRDKTPKRTNNTTQVKADTTAVKSNLVASNKVSSNNRIKNLQVLDFKSEKELKKYMKSISKDLGVKCKFCHDMNDKSKDTDHKLVAREMMKMQMDLNKRFFAQTGDSLLHRKTTLQISCWTCHRGSNEPQLIRPK